MEAKCRMCGEPVSADGYNHGGCLDQSGPTQIPPSQIFDTAEVGVLPRPPIFNPHEPTGPVSGGFLRGVTVGGELRVVSKTGGAKGSKMARFDLLPPAAVKEIAEHFGKGAAKYADRNWEKGYAWSLSYAALQRHLHAFWGGEDIDPETGSHHLAAAGFHVLALLENRRINPQFDDRPGKGAK